MKFIKLTGQGNGHSIYVNIDKIESVESCSDDGDNFTFVMTVSDTICVRETPEQIFEKIRESEEHN